MILRRLGNKKRIAEKIQQFFPEHTTYIEPFFGAGGMFFYKPKAKYNIMNDVDSEVFNLFFILQQVPDEFEKSWFEMPIHIDLWKHWKKNKETDPVKKAVRFVMLSNWGFMGKPQTMRLGECNTKKIVLDNIEMTQKLLWDVAFSNADFRELLKKVNVRNKKRAFIYCDPPYLATNNNYSEGFKESDSNDLFDYLVQSEIRFAMSEFDHPFILEQAEKRGLNLIKIGERRNISNRRMEVLVTNYDQDEV
ncbi:unnamed protein product [Scytosiphon promiscuus]